MRTTILSTTGNFMRAIFFLCISFCSISFAENHATTFTASSDVTAELGSNLLSNGSFKNDLSSWKASNWKWVSGAALHETGNVEPLSQEIKTQNGIAYL